MYQYVALNYQLSSESGNVGCSGILTDDFPQNEDEENANGHINSKHLI